MNRLALTVVDVLGLLIPGIVLLFGFCLAPVPLEWLQPLNAALLERLPILSNEWVAGGCFLGSAYTLGFLLRVTSLGALNHLTWRRWSVVFVHQTKAFNGVFEVALANAQLTQALNEFSSHYEKHHPGKYAPYFPLAKRLIRRNSELWAEAERLEAEVRFTAGLFFPFIVLSLDGIARGLSTPGAWVLLALGASGAVIVLRTFPPRRSSEVLYVQLLALTLLLYPDSKEHRPA